MHMMTCQILIFKHPRCYNNITWNIMTSSLLGVACFSWSTLLIASTKHLKCSSDHHFHVSLPSTTLGSPTHRRQAPTLREKWPFSKNHSWYSLEMTWLIDPSNGLNLMSNLDSFFKSFSFYLFKSFSFYQMILQSYLELKLHLHLEFDLDLLIWVPKVCKVHSLIKWPCTLYLTCY